MSQRIIYPTEKPTVELRQLVPNDAQAYFDAIDANRGHLSQFGDITAQKYPTMESVALSIEYPDPREPKLRMGIWDDSRLVGSVNLRPYKDRAEIGYWLDERYSGQGYATIAVRALASRAPRYIEVFANVNRENTASGNVLKRAGFTHYATDGAIESFSYKHSTEPQVQEPVLYSKIIEQDDVQSKARIGLRGLNAASINHGSTTIYRVLHGNGIMNIDGADCPLYEGAQVTVPAGTPYQDSGHLFLLATSTPPFDSQTVEILDKELL